MSDIDDFVKEKEKYDSFWIEWKKSNCKKLRLESEKLRKFIGNNKELRLKTERDKILNIHKNCLKSLFD